MAKRSGLFGTDGVRGRANVYPMTAEVALKLGQAVAHVFLEAKSARRHSILIGKDTRLSGSMFEDALAAGICSMGVDVIHVGPVPTPALAFLTSDMRCDAGVMITASHNPYQDNGIKFFGRDGYKLADSIEAKIERLIETDDLLAHRASPETLGKANRIDDVEGRYVVFLKNSIPRNITLDGMKIVLDCAHGSAYKVGPTVLRELGAEVVTLGVEPDGRNINTDCGSLHPERAAELVVKTGAHVGIAVDGDADRVIMIDDRGEVLDGDRVIALCARLLQERGRLKGGGVVSTVMSNLGLEEYLTKLGLKMVRTQVGDRYVVEAMRAGGYNLGGEQSGHVILLDRSTTGDGLMTALQILAVMVREKRALSELLPDFHIHPQRMINVEITERRPLEELLDFQKAVLEVEKKLGKGGRVLIRYSGTELKARVMVEGYDAETVEESAAFLATALKEALGGAV